MINKLFREDNMKTTDGILLTPEAEKVFLQLPGAIVWMNLEQKYLGINNTLAGLQGYKINAKAIGKTCFDIPSPAVELAEHFNKQEKLIMNSGNMKQYFGIIEFSGGKGAFVTLKKPLIDNENNIVGLFVQSIDITSKSLLKTASNFTKLDSLNVKKNKFNQFEYEITDNIQSNDLTPRETDCLFFVIRGKTAKEISRFLNISVKTVEHHIENIRQKLNCKNKNEIICKAFQNGFEKIVSNNIINIIKNIG